MEKETEQELIKKMIGFQKEEITSSIIYRKLAVKERIFITGRYCNVLQRMKVGTTPHYEAILIRMSVLIVLKSAFMYG